MTGRVVVRRDRISRSCVQSCLTEIVGSVIHRPRISGLGSFRIVASSLMTHVPPGGHVAGWQGMTCLADGAGAVFRRAAEESLEQAFPVLLVHSDFGHGVVSDGYFLRKAAGGVCAYVGAGVFLA